jgi:hypothetical protein
MDNSSCWQRATLYAVYRRQWSRLPRSRRDSHFCQILAPACPVAALRAWLDAAGIVEGALFRRVWNRRAQRVGAQRLTARIIADIVEAGASRLALDPGSFGAHSLRSGLVTTAVKRGVNLLKICDQTGHKSLEMLRVYCRDAELFVGNAAAGLL